MLWKVHRKPAGVCGSSESGKGAGFKCDLVLCCRIWLHGDQERAAWRLLTFRSVRDGNTHGLWGWLPEILWRGLLLAQALQVTDHIRHRTHTRTTGERRVQIVEVLPGYCSYFSYGEKGTIIILSVPWIMVILGESAPTRPRVHREPTFSANAGCRVLESHYAFNKVVQWELAMRVVGVRRGKLQQCCCLCPVWSQQSTVSYFNSVCNFLKVRY